MILQTLALGLTLSDVLQIIVSLLIAGLYYLTLQSQRRQTSIQENQAQIMQWQTRLMAAEYEPDLRIFDFSANGETAEVTISNIGEGRATNLTLKCLVYYKNNGDYATAFSNQVLGSVVVPTELTLSRLGEKEAFIGGEQAINTRTDNDSLKNSLGPKEDNIVFRADVELTIQALDPVMDVGFSRAVEHIHDKWDVDVIGFDFYLIYQDVVGQEYPLRVISVKDMEIDGATLLSDALERGTKMDRAVSTLVPEAGKPEDIEYLEENY